MNMRTSRTNGLMLAIVAAGILSAAYVASVTGGDINPHGAAGADNADAGRDLSGGGGSG